MSDRQVPACGREACCARVSVYSWELSAPSRPQPPSPPRSLGRGTCEPSLPPPMPASLRPQLTLLVVQVSILYYGGHLVISGQMTSGNLISFIIYEFVLGDCMEVRGWVGGTGVRGREKGVWGRGI